MSLIYRPAFVRNEQDISGDIANFNKRERDIVTPTDMSRLTSSWLQNVMVYVARHKQNKDLASNIWEFDECRDHSHVPTVNLS